MSTKGEYINIKVISVEARKAYQIQVSKLRSEGLNAPTIAKRLKLNRATVQDRVKRLDDAQGDVNVPEETKRGPKAGEYSYLSIEQQKAIQKLLIDKTPDQLRFNFALWTSSKKKGDYIIALKGNQGKLKDEAIDTTIITPASSYSSEIDYGHGRIEKRTIRVYRDIAHTISGLWGGLSSIIRVDSTRYDKKKKREHTEVRYYITSLKRVSAAKIGEYIRQHWEVENKLHWCLDVSFGEDYSQKRAANAAENFSRAIRFVINSFRRYKKLTNEKLSVKNMQFACAVDVEYMKKIFEAVFSV